MVQSPRQAGASRLQVVYNLRKERHSNAGEPRGRLRFYYLAAALIFLDLSFCLLWAGCGYHRVRQGNNLPDSIRSIAVPVFRNDSFESGVEAVMADALREQLVRSGFVRLKDVKHADAVIVGTIKKFSVKAISFSESDYAVEYRATIRVRIKLVDKNGVVLWEDKNVSRYDDYRVSADIFQTEAARRQAVEQIARDMMADVHDRIFDGFEIGAGGFPAR